MDTTGPQPQPQPQPEQDSSSPEAGPAPGGRPLEGRVALVAGATRGAGRGIAVEELTGIRDRVRLRKPQRVTLSSWSFHQLGEYLKYKDRRAGVPVVEVDPRHTSQTCYRCGHRDKRNRPDQETFLCRSCGVDAHADHNAALNIAQRGAEGWAAVNPPHVA